VPNPRFPGVEPRHARDCPATGWNLDRCTCSPTYRGTAWSRTDGRLLKSPPFASATAAKNWPKTPGSTSAAVSAGPRHRSPSTSWPIAG